MTAIELTFVFLITLFLTFVEDRIRQRDKIIIYALIGFVLILIAGTRTIYDTPDSLEYETMFYEAGTGTIMDMTNEPTFRFFSVTLSNMGFGVNTLFFLYAAISVPLHMVGLWKMSKLPFFTLAIYLSYYYQMHDLVQMRCSVASALFLFAFYFHGEGKKLYALLCIVIGIFFHYSAAAGILIFLLNNQELKQWQRWVAYCIVPIGLIVYYSGLDISYIVPEGLGGDKLDAYRKLKESGIEDGLAGWDLKGNLVIWLNILLFYVAIIYRNTLEEHCKYIHLGIKILAIAFLCLFFLHNVSAVLASRLCDYFEVVMIILWTAVVYLFTPMLAGKILVNFITTVRFVLSMLFYAMAQLTMDL
jgi:hypothetical protein